MSDLHDRIARALGWSPSDVRSLSMQSLRDLVRPVDPDLAREMDYVIQSGAYVRGEPQRRGHRSHAEKAPLKIWQREDWKAPGQTEPLKYSWKLVRPYVREDEVDEWLEIYRRDHPGVEFVASATKPRAKHGPKIMKGPGMTHATRRHYAEKTTTSQAYDEAKNEQRRLEQEVDAADATLKGFPRGAMGLIPDAVKSTPEYRVARERFQRAFARLQHFNTAFTKKFAKELRAERSARRGGQ